MANAVSSQFHILFASSSGASSPSPALENHSLTAPSVRENARLAAKCWGFLSLSFGHLRMNPSHQSPPGLSCANGFCSPLSRMYSMMTLATISRVIPNPISCSTWHVMTISSSCCDSTVGLPPYVTPRYLICAMISAINVSWRLADYPLVAPAWIRRGRWVCPVQR